MSPSSQVRNRLTGEILVLKVIQFDVSSDVIRKQASEFMATKEIIICMLEICSHAL